MPEGRLKCHHSVHCHCDYVVVGTHTACPRVVMEQLTNHVLKHKMLYSQTRIKEIHWVFFPVGENWFSSLMRIPFVIFWHCKNDETSTIVSFCMFKNFTLLNFVRGRDLGRRRLLFRFLVNALCKENPTIVITKEKLQRKDLKILKFL